MHRKGKSQKQRSHLAYPRRSLLHGRRALELGSRPRLHQERSEVRVFGQGRSSRTAGGCRKDGESKLHYFHRGHLKCRGEWE